MIVLQLKKRYPDIRSQHALGVEGSQLLDELQHVTCNAWAGVKSESVSTFATTSWGASDEIVSVYKITDTLPLNLKQIETAPFTAGSRRASRATSHCMGISYPAALAPGRLFLGR